MFDEPVHPSPPDWQSSVDAALVAQLQRRATAPGLVSLAVARRVLEGVEYLAGRLPLLAELSRRRGRAGDPKKDGIPIVHARPARDAVSEVLMAPPVERVTTRIIERAAARPAPPKGEWRAERPPPTKSPEAPRPPVVVIRGQREGAAPKAPSPPAAPSRLEGKQIERAVPLRRPARSSAIAGPGPRPSMAMIESPKSPLPGYPPIETVRETVQSSTVTRSIEVERETIHRAATPLPAATIAPAASPRVAEIGNPEPEVTVKVVHAITAPSAPPREATSIIATPVQRPPAAPRGTLVHAVQHVAPARATAESASPARLSPASPRPAESLPVAPSRAAPAQATAPASAAATPPSPPSAPPAHGPTSLTPGLDLEAVVDEVQRKLLRRLAAERERRGGWR